MKVIIAGSRTFNDYELLKTQCDRILISSDEVSEIISGGASGADRLGEKYAKEHLYPVKIFMANWNDYGKSAGYKRNFEMARYAKGNGMLIAFWDGKSKGTSHMIDIAGEFGLLTYIIRFDNKR